MIHPLRGALVMVLATLASPQVASAFDAATTHVGLTERAVFGSQVKRRLGALYAWGPGRALGLYRQLTLGDAATDATPAVAVPGAVEGAAPGATINPRLSGLLERLDLLDPAVGVRPDHGRLTALGWLLAGAVLEETPATRAQHHFLTPPDGGEAAGAVPAGPRGLDAGSVAAFQIGLTQPGEFGGRGLPSTSWLVAADNELGLPRFLDARERALAAATPALRESAAAESLLIAGALLHVIEDAAEPAYVHNDLVVDLFQRQAPFSRYVSTRYGRLALPAPAASPPPLVHLADAIHTVERTGLADRTAARFFSLGLLAAASGARSGGALAPAALPRLQAGSADSGYLQDAAQRRVAHWTRDANGVVRWDLDARCYHDAASVLLPEAGAAALAGLEHLFRGGLSVDASGVQNGDLALGAGRLRVILEEDREIRRELAVIDVNGAEARASLAALPPGAEGKHVVVVFRGVDGAGEPIVVMGEMGK